MKNTTHYNYEDLYDDISRIFTWMELIPTPFTMLCSISWIIIAILLLRKRDSRSTNEFHFESLRVHYLTALHRQRLIQCVILLIAINCILTDMTLTIRTAYQTYHLITKQHSNQTFHLELGQWDNYKRYHWLFIAWFVPMVTFSQSYYWTVALLPITTKAYFNINTSSKHVIAILIFIYIRGAIMALLWVIPYTIPFGIVMVILCLAFDWLLIMYHFITAYFVAKNRTKAFMEGLDEKDAIDSEFISKLRFLYLTFCLILSLIFLSMLQGMIIEYLLPMIVYPNCWLNTLYGRTIVMATYWDVGEKYKSTFSLLQLVSRLELRVLISLSRVVYLILSGVSFVFILRFKFKQRNGKKLKKKRVPKESTPLVVDD